MTRPAGERTLLRGTPPTQTLMEERNLYAPPAAPVADIRPEARQDSPWQLVAAIRLICGALVVGLIHTPFVLNRRVPGFADMPGAAIAILVAILIVVFVIVGLFIRAIYRGRLWARITYSLLAVGGSLPFTARYWERLLHSPVDGGIEIVQVLLEWSAVVLLWSGPTTRWFKERRSPTLESAAIGNRTLTER